ncbi:hypothetical protein BT96DRAFT_937636 [Gymnopus androsaceus JB14]|uniref:Uncharacterized protein n=1 Tax=Gymnopus androsaceus JB14 TaxID=1447944 RepID=A0A6A4HS00_9AGAR|nr:hypothetical protein BT96DRAFT_937636 [Gymnopus androsaceus JB14]
MWSANEWHAIQDLLPVGATMAPVIIASDKTQLTNFSGGKAAYPVYLTIGNLPKAIRRKPSAHACVLLAYLSVNKPVKKRQGISKKTLRLRNYQLFHRSMAEVLAPLKTMGRKGIVMVSGNGQKRKVHPILSSYVADYPEQCLVTCTKYGTCPKCRRKATELENQTLGEERTQLWTEGVIRKARSRGKTPSAIHSLAMEDDVAGGDYDPFWKGFPYCDIHDAIMPDVLHQLYQGVIKHLISWIQSLMTKDEFDSRLRSLPPAFGVRHFKDDSRGIIAARSLLDFIHLVQYPSHDGRTVRYAEEALDSWHANRAYFKEKEVRDHFNIPKFHSLLHYIPSIKLKGTTDNGNTEAFEHLHITFAKDGWRASNKRDAFPQMITWLS